MIKSITILKSFIALIFSLAIVGHVFAEKVGGAKVQANNASGAYSQVDLYGVTIYKPQQLWNFAIAHARLAGSVITPQEVRSSIKQIYREDGYFLADVEFRQAGNALHVYVHEGRISKIMVSGVSKEVATAIGKLLSDFYLDLEKVGYYLARATPYLIYRRALEVLESAKFQEDTVEQNRLEYRGDR